MKNIKKIQIIAGSMIAILIFIMVSTFGRKNESPQQMDEPTPVTQEIKIWCYWNQDYRRNILRDIVNEYNYSQNQVHISVRYIPDEDFKKELALAMAEGNAPEIALVDSSDFQFYHRIRPAVDLTDQIDGIKDYSDQALKPCRIDDRIYGLPLGLNCTVLYYNEDILQKAGLPVPSTWSELGMTAQHLKGNNHQGFTIPAVFSEETTFTFLSILWSFGGNENSINSPECQTAFELIRSLVDNDIITQESINQTMTDCTYEFATERLAMMIGSSDMVDSIRSINPDLKFNISNVPKGIMHTSVSGGEVFFVSDSLNQKSAIDFLKYLTEKTRMNNNLERLNVISPKSENEYIQFQNDPIKKKIKIIFQNAQARENTYQWPMKSQCIIDALVDTIAGNQNVESILQDAAYEMEKIRREYP